MRAAEGGGKNAEVGNQEAVFYYKLLIAAGKNRSSIGLWYLNIQSLINIRLYGPSKSGKRWWRWEGIEEKCASHHIFIMDCCQRRRGVLRACRLIRFCPCRCADQSEKWTAITIFFLRQLPINSRLINIFRLVFKSFHFCHLTYCWASWI